jgi:hypothetical protein
MATQYPRRDNSAIRCSEEMRDLVHVEAVRTQRSMIDVVEEALREWLDRQTDHPAEVPPKYKPYIGKLARILAQANPQTIEAVTRSLDVFDEFIAKPKPKPRPRRAQVQVIEPAPAAPER